MLFPPASSQKRTISRVGIGADTRIDELVALVGDHLQCAQLDLGREQGLDDRLGDLVAGGDWITPTANRPATAAMIEMSIAMCRSMIPRPASAMRMVGVTIDHRIGTLSAMSTCLSVCESIRPFVPASPPKV